VFDHDVLVRMANVADVPLVNLLSDRSHPLQALADALTMEDELGSLKGRKIAWIGDYNNVARSLAEAAAMLDMHVRFGCPPGFEPDAAELERIDLLGAASVVLSHRASEAVTGAHAVHTDTWVSMGQEHDKDIRRRAFEGFTVDDSMMARADPKAVFMHCLPAYRGFEVTPDVIDGPQSVVFQQGHNRLHASRGLLAFLMGVR
jgi:ornithine carbamoyltransferase